MKLRHLPEREPPPASLAQQPEPSENDLACVVADQSKATLALDWQILEGSRGQLKKAGGVPILLSSSSSQWSTCVVGCALAEHRIQNVDSAPSEAEHGLVVTLALGTLSVVIGARWFVSQASEIDVPDRFDEIRVRTGLLKGDNGATIPVSAMSFGLKALTAVQQPRCKAVLLFGTTAVGVIALHALLVLRTVRSASDNDSSFVPSLS